MVLIIKHDLDLDIVLKVVYLWGGYGDVHLTQQLEDVAERSWFASSQNPTRARIKAEQLQERHTFGELVQNKIITVPDLHKKILFSDEDHFWLNSWSDDNPQAYVETPLNPQKV